jgi:hypothetical protein
MSHKNHTVDVKEYEEFQHKNVLRVGKDDESEVREQTQ